MIHLFRYLRWRGPRSWPTDGSSGPPEAHVSWQSFGKGAGVPHSSVHLPPDSLPHPAGHLYAPDGWHDGGRGPRSTRGERLSHFCTVLPASYSGSFISLYFLIVTTSDIPLTQHSKHQIIWFVKCFKKKNKNKNIWTSVFTPLPFLTPNLWCWVSSFLLFYSNLGLLDFTDLILLDFINTPVHQLFSVFLLIYFVYIVLFISLSLVFKCVTYGFKRCYINKAPLTITLPPSGVHTRRSSQRGESPSECLPQCPQPISHRWDNGFFFCLHHLQGSCTYVISHVCLPQEEAADPTHTERGLL